MKIAITLKKEHAENAFLLTPVIFILISEILHFVAPTYGVITKFSGLLLMVGICVIKRKFNIISAILFLLLTPFFIYHFLISFNYTAASEEIIRYLFPIIILFYSYTLRNKFNLLFKFFLIYFIVNVISQLVNYIFWQAGLDLWFAHQSSGGYKNLPTVYGVLRASGITGFFGLFGFFFLVMFFLIETYYKGKLKKILMLISFLGMFASLSYKAIVAFFILIFLFSKKKLQIISGLIVLVFAFIMIYPEKTTELVNGAILRAELYVLEGTSARADSYRVMFEHTNLLGEGLGSFGGPSSVTYNSPVYEEVNFNWYGIKLATTDTYFPHLFIEFGLVGSLIYLIFILSPFIKRRMPKDAFRLLLVIYFALFFDAGFSFSLNNTGYLVLSLLITFPLVHHYKKNKPTSIEEVAPTNV